MTLEPQTAALLATLARMTGEWTAKNPHSNITGFRNYAADVFATFAGRARDETAFTFEEINIGSGQAVRGARLYRPALVLVDPPPVVVFFHGGGWMLGDLDSYHGLTASLSVLSQSVFISVDYRLAPEHLFPAGLEDAIMATQWVVDNASQLKLDGNRMAVMGDSAGGNLAAAVAQHDAQQPLPLIRAQYLLYPVLDVASPHSDFPSRIAFGAGNYFLTREAIANSAMVYLPLGESPADPRVSPLLASEVSGLAPCVVMVGSLDPLLDESKNYAARLQASGVETTLHIVEGGIHAFVSFGVLDLAQAARRGLASHIRHTFGRR